MKQIDRTRDVQIKISKYEPEMKKLIQKLHEISDQSESGKRKKPRLTTKPLTTVLDELNIDEVTFRGMIKRLKDDDLIIRTSFGDFSYMLDFVAMDTKDYSERFSKK